MRLRPARRPVRRRLAQPQHPGRSADHPQSGADDLQAILDALDMPGPYVLAAHSFAGNIARVFAAEHPDDVKGIVFVDVLSPSCGPR